MNIPTKFGFNWPSGFREKTLKCKSLLMTRMNAKEMAIPHITLLVSGTKNAYKCI